MTEFSRIGKALIEKTFREHDRPFRTRSLGQSLSAFGVSRVEEVFALVGEDRLSPLRVLEKLHPDIVIDDDREARDRSRGQTTQSKLKIKGDNAGTAVTIARCCHPLPGEAIVGIFTTGKGSRFTRWAARHSANSPTRRNCGSTCPGSRTASVPSTGGLTRCCPTSPGRLRRWPR